MKHILSIFTILVMLFFLGSCNADKKTIKVAFLFNDFNIPRWEREANLFKERITELGGEVSIEVADGDDVKQHSQVTEQLKNGVDVIVITVTNAVTAAAIVREAHENGVKIIAYDGLILNSDLDYLVGFDLVKVGELQAQYIQDKKPTGNYVLLNGDKAHTAAYEMYSGVKKVLDPAINNKSIDILYTGWIENWSGDNAYYYFDKIVEFSNKKIDAVIAANDGIASGVAKVLRERGMENQILVTGQDGDLSACYRIMKGEQTMTVYKSSKSIAYAAAELAMKVARNEKINDLQTRFNGRVDVPSMILNPIAVDKTNLESTVVAEGVYTMDEILNYAEEK